MYQEVAKHSNGASVIPSKIHMVGSNKKMGHTWTKTKLNYLFHNLDTIWAGLVKEKD